MTPDVFSVSPTDNLQTILQKLDTAIQSENATIEAATARRSELMTMRASLALLPTEAAPTAPLPPATATANVAEPDAPKAAAKTASKSTVKATTPKTAATSNHKAASKTTKAPGANGTATAPKSTTTAAAPQSMPKRTESKKPGSKAAPKATTTTDTAAKSTKTGSAAKATATNTASVIAFDLGRYQESVQESAGIERGTPLQEALKLLLASLPEQSLTTHEVIRRLYGALKPATHAEVLPLVQTALTTGLKRKLWAPAGSKHLPKYRHLPA